MEYVQSISFCLGFRVSLVIIGFPQNYSFKSMRVVIILFLLSIVLICFTRYL